MNMDPKGLNSNTSYFDRLYVWRPITRYAIRGTSNCIIGCGSFLSNGKGYTKKDDRKNFQITLVYIYTSGSKINDR